MSDDISPADAIAANRTLWDSWTRVHRDSTFYDVTGFLAGRDPLNRIESPIRFESRASYVAPINDGPLPEYNWPHGIGEVVSALIAAGLRILWLPEYPRTPYRFPGFLESRPDGEYGWPGGREDIPLTFTVGAVMPESVGRDI